MKTFVIIQLLIFSVLSCQSDEAKSILEVPIKEVPKIVPPLLSEVPSAEIFQINNSADTILISEKGGYISIPKNCFITDKGKEVLEDITISFTEYLNTADIMLSGIPMTYVDSGKTMIFQSAGMCKVLAYDNTEQLNLKKGKTIGVGLRSLAQDNDYNLYYFDTLAGSWIEKEKNIPVILAINYL